jgi:hypothetical protein
MSLSSVLFKEDCFILGDVCMSLSSVLSKDIYFFRKRDFISLSNENVPYLYMSCMWLHYYKLQHKVDSAVLKSKLTL